VDRWIRNGKLERISKENAADSRASIWKGPGEKPEKSLRIGGDLTQIVKGYLI
jgi:hypothetical protein